MSSQDEQKEILIDFLNALEAACVNAKHRLGVDTAAPRKATFDWNAENMKWIDKTNENGPFQIAKQEGEPAADFNKMVAHLKRNNGFLWREDTKYWLFQDGVTVGRRKKGAK
jgi:hypothetical protein